MKFLAVPNTNILIVNIELTRVKVINLKWPNLDYPSCHLVGRNAEISCDHRTLYSLSGVRVHDYDSWPVIQQKGNRGGVKKIHI